MPGDPRGEVRPSFSLSLSGSMGESLVGLKRADSLNALNYVVHNLVNGCCQINFIETNFMQTTATSIRGTVREHFKHETKLWYFLCESGLGGQQ